MSGLPAAVPGNRFSAAPEVITPAVKVPPLTGEPPGSSGRPLVRALAFSEEPQADSRLPIPTAAPIPRLPPRKPRRLRPLVVGGVTSGFRDDIPTPCVGETG